MNHTLTHPILVTVFVLMMGGVQPLSAELVADFEELTPTIAYTGAGGGHYENGENLTGSFTSGGATFTNDYDADWASWQGWAFSNTSDTTTTGYTNQYSAYALTGSDQRNNYGVVYSSAVVDLPSAPLGAHVTNTTYAALSMIHGDAFANKFGGLSGSDPDWFLLTISGTNAIGSDTGVIPFLLADYRSSDKADDYVLEEWTWVDLSSLGRDTRKLEFTLSSSDNGDWGMNTPAYFALDNLTTVPEPGTATLVSMALLCGIAGYSLRRRSRTNPPSAGVIESPIH